MKKSIFVITFIILSVLFSYSFVYAENAGGQVVNGVKDTINGVGNAAGDVVNGTAGAVKDGANAVKDTTQNAANDANNGMQNAGDDMKNGAENMGNDMRNGTNNAFNATRTSTENATNNDNNQGWMNRDIWTWIIVGIITIVIVALIWYYASRTNQ